MQTPRRQLRRVSDDSCCGVSTTNRHLTRVRRRTEEHHLVIGQFESQFPSHQLLKTFDTLVFKFKNGAATLADHVAWCSPGILAITIWLSPKRRRRITLLKKFDCTINRRINNSWLYVPNSDIQFINSRMHTPAQNQRILGNNLALVRIFQPFFFRYDFRIL